MRRVALPVFDAGGATPRKQNSACQRVGRDRQVGPALRLAKVTDCRRAAAPIARGQLEIARAFLARPVEIVVARKAGLLGRRDERFAQRMRLAHIGDGERSAGAVQRIGAALLILGAPEIRQHILEAPAGIAELPPVIEILRLTADIEQAIDGTRSAQHFAARLNQRAVIHVRLGLRRIEPIDPGVVEQLAVAERNVNPDVAVASAGLQQEHAMAARCGKPVGQNAARRAGSDDDIVESRSHGRARRSGRDQTGAGSLTDQSCLAAGARPRQYRHSPWPLIEQASLR